MRQHLFDELQREKQVKIHYKEAVKILLKYAVIIFNNLLISLLISKDFFFFSFCLEVLLRTSVFKMLSTQA